MSTGPRVTHVAALLLGLGAAVSAAVQAPPALPMVTPGSRQSPAPLSPPSGPGPTTPQASANVVANVQVQVLFDAYVVSQAQRALQLSNQQFSVFLPKLLVLQQLQRQHHNQRNEALADLRALVGPKAPQDVDDTSIAAEWASPTLRRDQDLPDPERSVGRLALALGGFSLLGFCFRVDGSRRGRRPRPTG